MSDNKKSYKPVFTWCSTDVDTCNFSRRCFMTGEYCSKQENIQKERQTLHEKNEINAFVVMNFSNMSDVVYKWRLRSFIETLKNHFYFNKNKTRLYCIDSSYLSNEVLDRLIEIEVADDNTIKGIIDSNSSSDCSEIKKNVIDVIVAILDQSISEEVTSLIDNMDLHSSKDIMGAVKELLRQILKDQLNKKNKDIMFTPVNTVNVIRADSNPSSNFVICNRVCQQLQIADLVIVDVSVENANVFYELGMAVALGKIILPICYSENFYKTVVPEQLSQNKYEHKYEHHIDYYPWRRELFEHFGIRFRDGSYTQTVLDRRTAIDSYEDQESINHKWETRYLPFETTKLPENGFSDIKYDRFPYLDEYGSGEQRENKRKIGEYIYNKLRQSYNLSTYHENTLIVYTMDGILNGKQVARCIVNYYHTVVRQFHEQKCFCGERVGILLQTNKIPEDPKDGPIEHPILYSVGEIIQIGMNQATYKAHMDMIKPDEFLQLSPKHNDPKHRTSKNESPHQQQEWYNNAVSFAKEFVRNRSVPIYPSDPVYVKRVMDGLQKDIFNDIILDSTNYSGDQNEREKSKFFFCLYHIMLKTLKYTNEIVVDISTNSVQSLFWLGAAHGSDSNAITVRREETEQDRNTAIASNNGRNNSVLSPRKERYIFDVAGLWTAVYRSNDTEGFYEQLAKVQSGIEQHSRLILKDRDLINEQLYEYFWEASDDKSRYSIEKLFADKEYREGKAMESYYRNRFWKPMLRYNRLHIYLRHEEVLISKSTIETKVPMWDVESVGLLSHYLSKRKQIGEYRIKSLGVDGCVETEQNVNWIFVGGDNNGIKEKIPMSKYIDSTKRNPKAVEDAHDYWPSLNIETDAGTCDRMIYRGFQQQCEDTNKKQVLLTQLPVLGCYDCDGYSTNTELSQAIEDIDSSKKVFDSKKYVLSRKKTECILSCKECKSDTTNIKGKYHTQIARLLLWRNHSVDEADGLDMFRVVISGVSGPSTKALASILVDDSLKGYNLKYLSNDSAHNESSNPHLFVINSDEKKERLFPLVCLQKEIRSKVISKYLETIDKLKSEVKAIIVEEGKISEIQLEDYFQHVKDSTELYLSTVLYRYFLPFLSSDDICRIRNGMQMYISSIRAANKSPFDLEYPTHLYDNYNSSIPGEIVTKVAESIPDALEKVLNSLAGVEVFYEVEVKMNLREREQSYIENRSTKPIDSRTIMGIKKYPGADIKCIFE